MKDNLTQKRERVFAHFGGSKTESGALSQVSENHRKSLIQHCERSELRLHFEWPKVDEKCQK